MRVSYHLLFCTLQEAEVSDSKDCVVDHCLLNMRPDTMEVLSKYLLHERMMRERKKTFPAYWAVYLRPTFHLEFYLPGSHCLSLALPDPQGVGTPQGMGASKIKAPNPSFTLSFLPSLPSLSFSLFLSIIFTNFLPKYAIPQSRI